MNRLSQLELSDYSDTSKTFNSAEIQQHLQQLQGWTLMTDDTEPFISKRFEFDNFIDAMAFANKVTELAEQANHHPRICIEWGKTQIDWWTHRVNGLLINDFIMAARCDEL